MKRTILLSIAAILGVTLIMFLVVTGALGQQVRKSKFAHAQQQHAIPSGPNLGCSPEGISLPKCPEVITTWQSDQRNSLTIPELGFRSDGTVTWRWRPSVSLVDVGGSTPIRFDGITTQYAHAQGPQKAVVPPADIPKPVAPIPIPAEEAAQLKSIQDEATKLQTELATKMQALQAQWALLVTRAAVRAKLDIGQLDTLVVEPGGTSGFQWVPRKVEAPKTPAKVN